MSPQKQKRARLAAGWVCLLAVAFMYAPLAGATWLASWDCCAAGFCKVPAHHHGKPNPAPSPGALATERPADAHCEHESGGMTACTMSCCQNSQQAVLMPVTFVLPAVSAVPQLGETLRVVNSPSAVAISLFVKPLSPPPRSFPQFHS